MAADPSCDIPDDDDHSISEDENEYACSQEEYIRPELPWALKYAAEAVRMVDCAPGMFDKPCDLWTHSGSRESELDEAPEDHIPYAQDMPHDVCAELHDWARACTTDIWCAPPEPPAGVWDWRSAPPLARHCRLLWTGCTGPAWTALERALYAQAVKSTNAEVPFPPVRVGHPHGERFASLQCLARRARFVALVLAQQADFAAAAEDDDARLRAHHDAKAPDAYARVVHADLADMYRQRDAVRRRALEGVPPAALVFAQGNLSAAWMDVWESRALADRFPAPQLTPFWPHVRKVPMAMCLRANLDPDTMMAMFGFVLEL